VGERASNRAGAGLEPLKSKMAISKNIQTLFANRCVLPDAIIHHAAIVIEDGVIAQVGERDAIGFPDGPSRTDFGDKIIALGLIDVHLHGFGGVQAGDSVNATHQIARAIPPSKSCD